MTFAIGLFASKYKHGHYEMGCFEVLQVEASVVNRNFLLVVAVFLVLVFIVVTLTCILGI